MFNRHIIEHVCFQQRASLDICFENRNRYLFYFLCKEIARKKENRNFFMLAVTCSNLHFKKVQHLTVSNAFPAQDFISRRDKFNF
jgi:hypothetical protein